MVQLPVLYQLANVLLGVLDLYESRLLPLGILLVEPPIQSVRSDVGSQTGQVTSDNYEPLNGVSNVRHNDFEDLLVCDE